MSSKYRYEVIIYWSGSLTHGWRRPWNWDAPSPNPEGGWCMP